MEVRSGWHSTLLNVTIWLQCTLKVQVGTAWHVLTFNTVLSLTNMQLVEISSACVATKSIVQLTTAICKLEIVKCLTVHWPRLLSATPTFTGLHMLQPDFKDNVRNNVLMEFSYSSFNHDVYLTWKLILKGFTAICVQYDHSVHNSVDKQLSMMAKLTISPPIALSTLWHTGLSHDFWHLGALGGLDQYAAVHFKQQQFGTG